MNAAPDPARNRFLVIQAVRLAGVALVMVGLLIVNRKIDLPGLLGYVLTVAGILDTLIVPTLLARTWKTPLP